MVEQAPEERLPVHSPVSTIRAALAANLDAARSAMNSIVIAEVQAITQQ